MTHIDLQHSDYIVYVDESGDHSLETINPRYPLFVLSFCVFEKAHYSHIVSPALRMLKFATFGHDMVILHEQDIRKKIEPFNKLNKEPREAFLEALSDLIARCNFRVIPIVIDKLAIKSHGLDPIHVYHLAMRLGLETLYQLLLDYEQNSHLTHVIFEARGKKEDLELELEFRRVCDYNNFLKQRLPFEIVIANKKTNSEGLQVADIVARPIGLSVLRPNQSNRAFTILKEKLYQDRESYVYPLKAKDPKVVLEVQTPVG